MLRIKLVFLLFLFSVVHDVDGSEYKGLSEISVMEIESTSGDLKDKRKLEARLSIVRSEALRYSSRNAYIYKLNLLIEELQHNMHEMDVVFDFSFAQQMATSQLSNAEKMKSLSLLLHPPVITEYRNVKSIGRNKSVFRKASLEFDIDSPARLSAQALNWRDFLLTKPNENIPDVLFGALPKNDDERGVWIEHVNKGWLSGVRQAISEMDSRVNRLKKIHRGMVRYVTLVDKGLVKPVKVSLSRNASEINATRTHMAVDVIRYRISFSAQFNEYVNKWDSALFSGELQVRRK
jgi:hypothetical protein